MIKTVKILLKSKVLSCIEQNYYIKPKSNTSWLAARLWIYILLLSFCLLLSSCLVSPGAIQRKIEKYPAVEEVLSVEDQIENFSQIIGVSVLLKNGGCLIVSELDYKLGGKYLYIDKLGNYYFRVEKLYRYNEREWRWSRYLEIQGRWLEKRIGYPVDSLKKIIDNYDDFLTLVERIYQEPPIPEKTWGHETLKSYTGYITGDDFKVKIYVYTEPWKFPGPEGL
jgi:hypothetical protein